MRFDPFVGLRSVRVLKNNLGSTVRVNKCVVCLMMPFDPLVVVSAVGNTFNRDQVDSGQSHQGSTDSRPIISRIS